MRFYLCAIAPDLAELVRAHQSHLRLDVLAPSFAPVSVAEQGFRLYTFLGEFHHCKPCVSMDWLRNRGRSAVESGDSDGAYG